MFLFHIKLVLEKAKKPASYKLAIDIYCFIPNILHKYFSATLSTFFFKVVKLVLGAILILRNAGVGEEGGARQLRYFVLRCKRGGEVFIVKIRYVTHEKKTFTIFY